MRLVFVDDSEETDCQRQNIGPLVGVGAVVFPEEGIARYRDSIRQLRIELGVPPDTELKWSPDDGSWLKTPAGNEVRTDLRIRMLQLAAECDVTSVAVIWDRNRRDWVLEDTRSEVLQYLYDKVSGCLRSLPGREIGIVIADEPGGGRTDHQAWLAHTLRLTDAGTPWTNPDQIVLPFVTAPSHHLPHLQLADLVTGATVAAVAGNPYALKLLSELKPIVHTNFYGTVGGAGLTLWPPTLANLYFHLYGDSHRWHSGSRVQLPYSGWDYYEDDGIPIS